MPEAWIRFDAAELRGNWWRVALLILTFLAYVAWVLFLPPGRTNAPMSAAERGWWIGGLGAFWFVAVLTTVAAGYGRTLLTSDGMQFHTWVSRRFVPWQEVVDIEKHRQRSGFWWVRVRRSHG